MILCFGVLENFTIIPGIISALLRNMYKISVRTHRCYQLCNPQSPWRRAAGSQVQGLHMPQRLKGIRRVLRTFLSMELCRYWPEILGFAGREAELVAATTTFPKCVTTRPLK